jgi:hypothetical protein
MVEFVLNPKMPSGEVGTFAPIISFHASDQTEILTRLDSSGIQYQKPNELQGGMIILGFQDPNGVTIHFVAGDH